MKGNWEETIRPGGTVYKYVHDAKNDLVHCDPLPEQHELTWWYENKFDYKWYKKRWLLKRLQSWHRWQVHKKRILKFFIGKNNKKILDIGCGYGWFLKEAIKYDFEAYGIDYKSLATDNAKKEGIKIFLGNIADVDVSEKSFDLVTMWHSLEHTLNPTDVLKKIKHVLKPDGAALIVVPNLKCRGIKRRNVAWVWVQQPFVHIWHWSPNSLKNLIQSVGFDVIYIQTRDTWDANYIFDAFLNSMIEILVYKYGRKLDVLGKRIGLNKLNIFQEYISFSIVESTRLCFYILYLILKPFQKERYSGSELAIFVKKK